ncbi:MAG: enolase [Lysobacterales bacterium]
MSLEVIVSTPTAKVCAAPSYSDPRSSGKYEITHFPAGGVQGSINLINSTIRKKLIGRDSADQESIDDLLLKLDGTGNFDLLGGNTAEATSMAVAKAAAASLETALYEHVSRDEPVGVPHLMPNIIGGGATMGDEAWKGRTPDIQDHIILPVGCTSFWQELEAVSAVFHRTGQLLCEVDPTYTGGRDEEYCWLPGIDDVTALEVLKQACDEVGRTKGIGFRLGLDVGAADLWDEDSGLYIYRKEGIKRTPEQHARHLGDLANRFDLFYLEDSFYEDHVELYVEQVQQFGERIMIAGDDLLAGNLDRLEEMTTRGAINAAVVKLNMAGTVSRTSAFVERCKEDSLTIIGSCRTYDSPDDTLADLVVGWGCNTYKCGSPAGGEHAAKQNRYMRIDEELGNEKSFIPWPALQP